MPPPSVRFCKRVVDVVAASVGLCICAPLFPVVALAIRLDSKGPLFYRQRRAGVLLGTVNGAPVVSEFTIVKFRTMKADAEAGTGAVLAAKNDDRVTRLGRILRKSRIDEVPQLWNILVGDMSLVGPRPERPELLTNFAMAIPFFEERLHDVKPGLTGLAQIKLGYTGSIGERSELSQFVDALHNPFGFEEAKGALADDMRSKLLYDLAYCAALEDFSTFIRMELSVLIQTPLVMLRAGGH